MLIREVRGRLFSFVFKDVLSPSELIALVEIEADMVFVTAFCSESKCDDEVSFSVEAAAFEAVAPVADAKHDFAEFVLIVDGNEETVVDTTDCVVVVFDVTGFDNKLNTKI